MVTLLTVRGVLSFSLDEIPKTSKLMQTESRLGVVRGWGRRMKSDCLVDIRFPFGVMKIILEIEEIMARKYCEDI